MNRPTACKQKMPFRDHASVAVIDEREARDGHLAKLYARHRLDVAARAVGISPGLARTKLIGLGIRIRNRGERPPLARH